MKKIALLIVLLGAGGYLAAAHLSGGSFFVFGLPLGGDRGHLRRISSSFLEDLQFKDYRHAATYHSPDKQQGVDIPYLIHRLFLIKPELLEVMSYEIAFAELDSTLNRGRVKTRIKAKDLMQQNVREQELMLYFEREGAGAPWYMKLEDSLREIEKDPAKKG